MTVAVARNTGDGSQAPVLKCVFLSKTQGARIFRTLQKIRPGNRRERKSIALVRIQKGPNHVSVFGIKNGAGRIEKLAARRHRARRLF